MRDRGVRSRKRGRKPHPRFAAHSPTESDTRPVERTTFRNVVPGDDPAAFVFLGAAVIAPDGTVSEPFTWDSTQGVRNNNDLVTCSFIIPIGDLTGYRAEFYGFFVGR